MAETNPQTPESLLHGAQTDEDLSEETGLRPRTLAEFQGQSRIKENLKVFIEAAKQRKEALDHLFISGPPGLGKTTLAAIIANELGVELRITSAPALEKVKDLVGLLTSLSPHSIFFIDEIHRLRSIIEEMLYIAMEDYEIDWIIGEGPAARSVRIPIPPFTLIGATTRPGSLSSPLLSRFGIPLRLHYYSQKELQDIILRSAQLLPIAIEPDALPLLARCTRGTPRVANRILRRMRDFAQIEGESKITHKRVQESLRLLEIDSLGLERVDREILKIMIQKFGGGPVGVETLAIAVGESRNSLEDFYEPYLIQCGLLSRSPRGRVVTETGYQHFENQS